MGSFCLPGQILFAVKLTQEDIVVPVTVPQFDLRFPKETFWYVRKTCVQRWRNLENRIKRNLLAQAKRTESKVGDMDVAPPPSDGEAETEEDEKLKAQQTEQKKQAAEQQK